MEVGWGRLGSAAGWLAGLGPSLCAVVLSMTAPNPKPSPVNRFCFPAVRGAAGGEWALTRTEDAPSFFNAGKPVMEQVPP